jgi:hypothetical protein
LTLAVVSVLIHIELVIFSIIGFVSLLVLVSYGASLEDKYRRLEKKYNILKKEKEQDE